MADVKLIITDRAGEVRNVTAQSGDVLMQVLREHVDLTLGTCGGAISCGTCLVTLSPQWLASLPPASGDEAEMLEALDAGAFSRLSCQLSVDVTADGMKATIAPEE